MLSEKIIEKYKKVFSKSKKEIKKEISQSGAIVDISSIKFKYGKIISIYDSKDKKYEASFSVVNRNANVIIEFVDDNEYQRAGYMSNMIYPHTEDSHEFIKNNNAYRHLCLGGNFDICDKFLKKFQLTNLKMYLEDTLKQISTNGYWYPDYCFEKDRDGMVYEFTSCKFCYHTIDKEENNTKICENCRSTINRKFKEVDLKLLKRCKNHGVFFLKTNSCEWCRKQ